MDSQGNIESLARSLLRQRQEDMTAKNGKPVKARYHRVGRLRVTKREAYTPGLVAIGPLHAADTECRLRTGHLLKMEYLDRLVSRGHPDPATHLAVIQRYVRVLAAREPEARAMYAAEDVDKISADDLVKMLVLDGCFIIEHLVNVILGLKEPSLHAIPFGPSQLSVDLILAENQLPFFVLVDLIRNTRLPEFHTTVYDPPVLLMDLVLYYLAGVKGLIITEGLPKPHGVSHILHLLHGTITSARNRDGAVSFRQRQDLLRKLLLYLAARRGDGHDLFREMITSARIWGDVVSTLQREDLLNKLLFYLAARMQGVPLNIWGDTQLFRETGAVTGWPTRWRLLLLIKYSTAICGRLWLDLLLGLLRVPLGLLTGLLVPLLYSILPEEQRWSARYGLEDLPSASDLKRMFLMFKAERDSGGGGSEAAAGIASLLGPVPLAVKLQRNKILRLPLLWIEFRTAPLLLNLIAFEQSSLESEQQRDGRDVSAYAWLMAKLVRSPEDARVLVAAEVVQTSTAGKDQDVARFFREVGAATQVAPGLERSYISELLGKLRERSRRQTFKMWVDVQRSYFTVPWAVVVEFVTFFTLISNILQIYGSFNHK